MQGPHTRTPLLVALEIEETGLWHVIPPGMATMESAARHLEISPRRLNALAEQTPLQHIAPVALGRSLGTYRLIPLLGILVLRQLLPATPWHLAAWRAALDTACRAAILPHRSVVFSCADPRRAPRHLYQCCHGQYLPQQAEAGDLPPC